MITWRKEKSLYGTLVLPRNSSTFLHLTFPRMKTRLSRAQGNCGSRNSRSQTLRSHWSAPRTRPLFKGNESSRNVQTTVQSRPDRLSYLFLLTWFVLTGNSKPRSGPKINYQYISNVKNTINQRATMVYKSVDSCLLFIILWTSLNHSGALSRAKFALRNTIGKKIW